MFDFLIHHFALCCFILAGLVISLHIASRRRTARRQAEAEAAARREAIHREEARQRARQEREREQAAAANAAARAAVERARVKAEKETEKQARAEARARKQAEKLEAARLLAEYNERALNAARELRNLQQQKPAEVAANPAAETAPQILQQTEKQQEQPTQRRQAISLDQFAAAHAVPARRGIFAGETIAFTGPIPGIPRREAMQLTKQAGGMAYPHINTRCTLLVVGDGAERNQAMEDADRWNVRKITWQTWKAHIEHDAAAA